MSENVEGTFVVDGLIEGRLPARPDADRLIRAWAAFAEQSGRRFHVEVEGNTFSLLPDNTPRRASETDPARAIAAIFEELLKLFRPAEAQCVLSTLRSVEYRRGQAVQSLYMLRPDGTLEVRQRSVPMPTVPPPRAARLRDKLRPASAGVAAAALLLLAVSAWFIDYRTILRTAWRAWVPPDAAAVRVENGAFEEFFHVEKRTLTHSGEWVLSLRRTERFPRTPEQAAALNAAESNASRRLALQALAVGYIRCEYLDEEGRFLGGVPLRIKPLRQAETMEAAAPLPRGARQAVLTY